MMLQKHPPWREEARPSHGIDNAGFGRISRKPWVISGEEFPQVAGLASFHDDAIVLDAAIGVQEFCSYCPDSGTERLGEHRVEPPSMPGLPQDADRERKGWGKANRPTVVNDQDLDLRVGEDRTSEARKARVQ